MPVLLTKIEGRGNGIKTVIPNMEDVARALARPPTCKLSYQSLIRYHFIPDQLRNELTKRSRQILWLRTRRPDLFRRRPLHRERRAPGRPPPQAARHIHREIRPVPLVQEP